MPNYEEDAEVELFEMGDDEDFDGLRPEREVGEEQFPIASTGHNVVLEPTQRRRRPLGTSAIRVNNRRVHCQLRREGRRRDRTQQRRAIGEEEVDHFSEEHEEHEEREEEETLYRNNLGTGSIGARANTVQRGNCESRRVRQRLHSQDDSDHDQEMFREHVGNEKTPSSASPSSSNLDCSDNNEASSNM